LTLTVPARVHHDFDPGNASRHVARRTVTAQQHVGQVLFWDDVADLTSGHQRIETGQSLSHCLVSDEEKVLPFGTSQSEELSLGV